MLKKLRKDAEERVADLEHAREQWLVEKRSLEARLKEANLHTDKLRELEEWLQGCPRPDLQTRRGNELARANEDGIPDENAGPSNSITRSLSVQLPAPQTERNTGGETLHPQTGPQAQGKCGNEATQASSLTCA
jgi:hypothetical protein